MKRRPWRIWLTAYAFLIPSLLVLGAFTFYPVVEAARLSLWRWRILRGDPVFIGLANYETLFSSADFWQAVGNTIVFAVGSIPTSMILALFLALLLNRPLRGLAFYRTAYFLPTITSLVAVSVVWMWIYHPDVGLMNQLIGLVGLPPARWLNEPRTAMLSLIILGVWRGLGYNVIIYLGGLQSIAKVASGIVPFMALTYVAISLGLIILNLDQVPAAIAMIISDAFTGSSTYKLGFAYCDGVDSTAVPQDDDYFVAASTALSSTAVQRKSTTTAPVTLPKDAYLILTNAGAAQAAAGIADFLIFAQAIGIEA